MSLYIPPQYCKSEKPLIFLAGPIRGAPRWQNQAVKLLVNNEIDIASPRYIGEGEEKIGDWAQGITPQEQIDWETFHMKKAGEKGVILFWLAREEKHECKVVFARTTRFELGEWMQKHILQGAKIVVGIEKGFSGGEYIEYRLRKDCPKVPIERDLKGACNKGLELINMAKFNSR